MVDYMKEINYGLQIEKPNIILPWNLQKKNIFDITNNIKVLDENYYTFKIRLFGIPFIDYIGLYFEKETLSRIDLFNNKYYHGLEIIDDFKTHQLILESFFGKPNRKFLSEKFKGFNKQYKWKFGHITILHELRDISEMKENLTIFVNGKRRSCLKSIGWKFLELQMKSRYELSNDILNNAYEKYYKGESITYEEFIIMLSTNEELYFMYNGRKYEIEHMGYGIVHICVSRLEDSDNTLERNERFDSIIDLLQNFKIDGKRIPEIWSDVHFTKPS